MKAFVNPREYDRMRHFGLGDIAVSARRADRDVADEFAAFEVVEFARLEDVCSARGQHLHLA
jgi:hypothetical protein